MNYNGFLIDEEKENITNKQIFTVWDGKGIYHLGTFCTVDSAKSFVDNGAEQAIAKIKAMRRKYNR